MSNVQATEMIKVVMGINVTHIHLISNLNTGLNYRMKTASGQRLTRGVP